VYYAGGVEAALARRLLAGFGSVEVHDALGDPGNAIFVTQRPDLDIVSRLRGTAAAPSASIATMRDTTEPTTPTLRQVVLDCEDARVLAEFYRQFLGFRYRPGDEPPTDGTPGYPSAGLAGVVRRHRYLAPRIPAGAASEPTWPEGPRPQMLHLDTTVPTVTDLHIQHQRALALGARLLLDRSEDDIEPLFVYADPAGHPFCIFVAPA
jgi:catechol 2,3-dioxygenase-like lactoylglutathione lyase family enzyme